MNIAKAKPTQRHYHKRRAGRNRKGAAVIEFAVCLPLIVLIMLGSIEAANLLFLRQALVQASYEGAKAAIRLDANNFDVEDVANLVAQGRRLKGFTVETVPADVSMVAQGEMIRVRTAAPVNSNSFISGTVFRNLTLDAEAVMVKE